MMLEGREEGSRGSRWDCPFAVGCVDRSEAERRNLKSGLALIAAEPGGET